MESLVVIALVIWFVPALWGRRNGPRFEVFCMRDILVPIPLEACSLWIRDARNLPIYEQKVQRCTVDTSGPTVLYTCVGTFFSLPWRGTFSMQHTPDGGFHSTMVAGAHVDNASGGFRLRPTPAGTRVTHYERYAISVWIPFAAACRPLLRSWLAHSMDTEMRIIESALLAAESRVS